MLMNNIILPLKRGLEKLVHKYDWYALYSLYRRGYLYDTGWFQSHRQKASVDRNGEPIPWMTYPSLTFLEERLKREFVVFEYGSGNSTLWWANRCNHVISCEHDADWYAQVLTRIPENVELKHVSLELAGEYSRFIGQYRREFDIIVIDGRDRVQCIRNSFDALKEDGVLILDNSDVEEYEPGLALMHDLGMKRIDFSGPGPITTAGWRTSIFYRDVNCLGI